MKNKILIFSPDLILHKKIFESFESAGYELEVVENNLSNNIRARHWDLLGFIYFVPVTLKNYFWYFRNLKDKSYKSYDYFIVFNHYPLPQNFIKRLRKSNSQIKTIIYFEDSFNTWNHSYQMKYFDRCLSFDKHDSIKYGRLFYLPWFIVNDIENKDNIIYDLCFIGTISYQYKYRLPLIKFLTTEAERLKLNVYFMCYTPLKNAPLKSYIKYLILYYRKDVREVLRQIKEYSKYDFITNKRISFKDVEDIETRSACIVDINMERQGISPRIIAALASNKKVIINNKYIKNEPFYSPNNVWVIDNKNPSIDIDFLNKPCDELNLDGYKINNWLLKLLDIDKM